MKSNLQILQEQMKERMASQQRTVDVVVKKSDGTSEIEKRLLCSTPNCMRVRRKGKLYCSRCTDKGTESKLRDPLLSAAIEAGIIERQTSRTGDDDILEVSNEPLQSKSEDEDILESIPSISSDTTAKNIPLSVPIIEEHIVQGIEKFYSRKQVAQMLGTSPSSIQRWEKKGSVAPPKKLAHSGLTIYTEEDVIKLREYLTKVTIAEPTRAHLRKSEDQITESTESSTPGTFNLSVNSIKKLGKGSSDSKRMNRAVAARLSKLL